MAADDAYLTARIVLRRAICLQAVERRRGGRGSPRRGPGPLPGAGRRRRPGGGLHLSRADSLDDPAEVAERAGRGAVDRDRGGRAARPDRSGPGAARGRAPGGRGRRLRRGGRDLRRAGHRGRFGLPPLELANAYRRPGGCSTRRRSPRRRCSNWTGSGIRATPTAAGTCSPASTVSWVRTRWRWPCWISWPTTWTGRTISAPGRRCWRRPATCSTRRTGTRWRRSGSPRRRSRTGSPGCRWTSAAPGGGRRTPGTGRVNRRRRWPRSSAPTRCWPRCRRRPPTSRRLPGSGRCWPTAPPGC